MPRRAMLCDARGTSLHVDSDASACKRTQSRLVAERRLCSAHCRRESGKDRRLHIRCLRCSKLTHSSEHGAHMELYAQRSLPS